MQQKVLHQVQESDVVMGHPSCWTPSGLVWTVTMTVTLHEWSETVRQGRTELPGLGTPLAGHTPQLWQG